MKPRCHTGLVRIVAIITDVKCWKSVRHKAEICEREVAMTFSELRASPEGEGRSSTSNPSSGRGVMA